MRMLIAIGLALLFLGAAVLTVAARRVSRTARHVRERERLLVAGKGRPSSGGSEPIIALPPASWAGRGTKGWWA